MAMTTVMYRTVTGLEADATGVIAAGNNDSLPFVPYRGRVTIGLNFVKASITSFTGLLQMLADDNVTWLDVLDSARTAFNVFGTISATTTKTYPIYLAGATLPIGVQCKIVINVTGAPATTDAVRLGFAESA